MAAAGNSKIENRDQYYVNILQSLYYKMLNMCILLTKQQRSAILTTHTLVSSTQKNEQFSIINVLIELFHNYSCLHRDMQFHPLILKF